MARYGDNAIDEVRQRADIVEIIGAHVRLRRAGRNFVGLCPFHNEKTPSFSVNAERGFYHCFGCGAGGTVFNFMMKIEGLSFPEAIRSLATRYGVSLPEQKYDGPAAAERDALTRANQTAGEFYAHVLWNTHDGELAREYLRSRGITVETARAFMLGFSPARPASLAKALEKRGLTEAGLKAGVVKRDAMGLHDAFRARVMFPIRDAQGKVIAFGGRVMDARMPKYLNSPESPAYSKTRTLYGLHEARAAIASQDRVIIVEGYFDVIALWQAGFRETVASCGTSLTVEQLRLLSRYTKNVLACFDGDDAGRKASLRALEIFVQAGLAGSGIIIPSGFDPDTFVRDRGVEEFEALIKNANPLIDFFLDEQVGPHKGTVSLAIRSRATERVVDLLEKASDSKLFDLLVRRAGEKLGVGDRTVREAVARQRKHSTVVAAPITGGGPELLVLAVAAWYPALRPKVIETPPFEQMADKQMAQALIEVCASDRELQDLLPMLEATLPQQHVEQMIGMALSLRGDPESESKISPLKNATFLQYFGEVDEQAARTDKVMRTGTEDDLEIARKALDSSLEKILQRDPAPPVSRDGTEASGIANAQALIVRRRELARERRDAS